MQLSQGFTAEVKEEEGGDVHGSGSFTLAEMQHPGTAPAARVVVQGAGRGWSCSIPHSPSQPHPCVILQPCYPTEGLLTVIFSVNF